MLPTCISRSLSVAALCLPVCCSIFSLGQFPGSFQPHGENVDTDTALSRALKTSSLTESGKPFHAVMDICSAINGYSGRIEFWWVNDSKYKLNVSSPAFTEEKVVNGEHVFEKDGGDYYPRWLENFVLAVLDPIPMAKNFRGRGGTTMLGEHINSCLRRDDRPGGITDQMTWGVVCFNGSEPHISSVQTMNISIEYSDWKGFEKKKIARTYQTDVLDFQPVTGHLTTLDELKQPDDAMFAISTDTPAAQRIATELVSTLKEESMFEKVPTIEWPSVREGKTEGYMIVYARTDTTGQVRETAKHNSDQPGLEQYGMEQALKYKFKPLIVNGVAEQMEMPLVLHFTSRLDNPIPILTVEQMKKQIVDCRPSPLPPGSPTVTIRVSVNEAGKMTGMGPVGKGGAANWLEAMQSMENCRYAPYVVNGVPTYYKGDIELKAP